MRRTRTIGGAFIAGMVACAAALVLGGLSGAAPAEHPRSAQALDAAANKALGPVYGGVIELGDANGAVLLSVTTPRALPKAWRVIREARMAQRASLAVVPGRFGMRRIRRIVGSARNSAPLRATVLLSVRGHRHVVLILLPPDATTAEAAWATDQRRRWGADRVRVEAKEPARAYPN